MNKLISIIVPVYNVDRYLCKCLDSLINQTYKFIEIIIINDGSTDSSLEIAEKYKAKDDRIVIFSKKNGGLSSARNYGITKINGAFVMFVDSDDSIKLNAIELMYNKSLEDKLDIVVCDMEYLYDDESVVFSSGGNLESLNKQDNQLCLINNSACNKLISSNLLHEFNFPQGLWYEDLGSIPLLLYKANKIGKVDEALYTYYQRSGSISHSDNLKIFDIYKCINLLKSTIGNNANTLYIIHGLELTTLRIKDFDEKSIRKQYLKENMFQLNLNYPKWYNDEYIKQYTFKKKFIFKLLKYKMYTLTLMIYDRAR